MAPRKTAEMRKVEIVEAALLLAGELGPDRLTTMAIAREVGLTQPGIFRHFATKQAIWQAVIEAIARTMAEAWQKALAAHGHPLGRLRALIAAQLRLIKDTPAIPSILFSRELHAENETLRKSVFDLMGQFHKTIAGQAADARRHGAWRGQPDPTETAFLLIALVQGLALRWSLSSRSFDLVEEGLRLFDIQIALLTAGSALASGTGSKP